MKKDKIKGIIFDLGGVLVDDLEPACLGNASKNLKVSFDKLKRIIQNEVSPLQRGEENSIQFWQRICKKLYVRCPSDNILSSLWEEPYRESVKVKKDMLDLVKRLRGKYKLAILSNTIIEHAAVNRKRKLLGYFNVVLFSNEVGMRKPERRFFELAAERLGISFNNLVFVDNDIQLVRAARKYGLSAILFKSSEQLEKSFNRLGINIGQS